MPLPPALTRFNRRVANRILGPLAPTVPGFGVVMHQGRTSGRRYRTPVNVFRRNGMYVLALPYGPRTDWVRNVLAAGGCALETRGRTHQLTRPRLYHDQARRGLPGPVRFIYGVLAVADFLELAPLDAYDA